MNSFSDQERAIEWLIEYVLPFVNSASISEIAESLVKVTDAAIILGTDDKMQKTSETTAEEIHALTNDKMLSKQAEDLNVFIKQVMTIALIKKPYDELPADIKNHIDSIEKRITKHFSDSKPVASWRGMGQCCIDLERTLGSAMNIAEKAMIHAIVACLYCDYSLTEENRMLVRGTTEFKHSYKISTIDLDFSLCDSDNGLYFGQGYFKIGMCPNCGVFFRKSRKDQEYCSRSCKSAFISRKIRCKM
ncbi:MAG: hypothetical protein GQF41_4297 [Candidatus Rifleibacterium amylolyticum]|nr:MAG: hypothetical protein GQF41_4297 [Candidatus Rifleibacterium amylolyticum]